MLDARPVIASGSNDRSQFPREVNVVVEGLHLIAEQLHQPSEACVGITEPSI